MPGHDVWLGYKTGCYWLILIIRLDIIDLTGKLEITDWILPWLGCFCQVFIIHVHVLKLYNVNILAGEKFKLFASEMLQNLLLSKLLIFKKYPLISLISNSLLKIMN